jgi:hypothetical protein
MIKRDYLSDSESFLHYFCRKLFEKMLTQLFEERLQDIELHMLYR